MYISSFHIDGFGLFTDVEVKNLKPGLSVFFGANEAGKSTCLEFLRVILTGYPEKHKKAYERRYTPLNKRKEVGGSATLVTSLGDEREELRVIRRPGKPAGLYAADGAPLPANRLDIITRGVTPEVYRKVFGFSLGELETFESLSADEVRNALYGASFGAAIVSPAKALASLTAQKEAIFKKSGEKPPLNAALKELEELRAAIADLLNKNAEFDPLSEQREECVEKLKILKEKRSALEKERRELERRLGAWRQWETWRELRARADKLGPEPENFPEEARDRLYRLTDAKNLYETQLAARKEKLSRLAQTLSEITADTALLEIFPELKRLAERKNSFRQATGRLQSLKESEARGRGELESQLSQLGPGWDCERVRSADRSLFAREDMEKSAREMNEALAAHQASVDFLNNANREIEERERALKSANASLENLPHAEAELNEGERDDLRRNMARLEESRRLAPGRERALETATRAFSRALDQIHVKAVLDESGTDILAAAESVQGVLRRQEEALALANDIRTRAVETAESVSETKAAAERYENIKKKIEDVAEEARARVCPGRDTLETRNKALRNLRSLGANISSEEERLKELSSRLEAAQGSSGFKNRFFIFLALVFAVCAGLCCYALWGLGASEILLGSLVIPVNSWTCYGALLCAAVCMAAAFPGYGSDRRRAKRELALLRARKETCENRLNELKAGANQALQTAEVESWDPITLDAAEMLLEREREQCFHEERTRLESDALKKELEEAKNSLEAARNKEREREAETQLYRHKWHNLMQDLNLNVVPAPDSAPTIFARAESALVAYENVFNARKEQDALWEDLHVLEQNILSFEPIKKRLENSGGSMSLEDAVRQTLENCREADILRENRIRLQTAAKAVAEELARARENQETAADRLAAASERLENARKNWSEALVRFGLEENLTPETAREAFKYMANCLNAEEKLLRARKDLEACDAEIKGFREPLRALIEKLGRPPILGADNSPDWSLTLDGLMEEAEKAAEARSERERLARQIADEEREKKAGEAAFRAANEKLGELYAGAGVNDADELLRLAREQEERRSIAREIESAEAALSSAAAGEPLDSFLAKFREDERDAQEARLLELGEELENLDNETRETATSLGSLSTRLKELASEEKLSDMRQRESMLRESVREMAFDWTKLALSERLILRAKNIYEKERQPEVIRMASGIFSQITGGKWRGISASLENSDLVVISASGEPRSPETLSRGAQEQAYLSLRLAYIRDHAKRAGALPVIMDEILVNFDPERAERAAKAFANLGADQQIFYFTCQPHVLEILKKASPEATIYNVFDGQITAA